MTPTPASNPLDSCPFCPGEVRPVIGDPWSMVHVGDRECVFGVSQFRIDRWNRRAPSPSLKVSPQADPLDVVALVKKVARMRAGCKPEPVLCWCPPTKANVGHTHACDQLRAALSGNPGQLAQAPALDPEWVAMTVQNAIADGKALDSKYWIVGLRLIGAQAEAVMHAKKRAQPIEKLEQLSQAPGEQADDLDTVLAAVQYYEGAKWRDRALGRKALDAFDRIKAAIFAPQPPESNRGGDARDNLLKMANEAWKWYYDFDGGEGTELFERLGSAIGRVEDLDWATKPHGICDDCGPDQFPLPQIDDESIVKCPACGGENIREFNRLREVQPPESPLTEDESYALQMHGGDAMPTEIPTAKPAESLTPCPACADAAEESGASLCDPHYVELCQDTSFFKRKPGAGDTAEGPTPDPVFDERHDSECNWRVKREMCDCWLKDEEADDNMATDRAAWPGSTDGGKA